MHRLKAQSQICYLREDQIPIMHICNCDLVVIMKPGSGSLHVSTERIYILVHFYKQNVLRLQDRRMIESVFGCLLKEQFV